MYLAMRTLWVLFLLGALLAGQPARRARSEPGSGIPPKDGTWLLYVNSRYGFSFWYPQGGQVLNQMDSYVRVALPITPGTTLLEKQLQVYVAEGAPICRSPLGYLLPLQSSQSLVFNGLPILKETGVQVVNGQVYEWVAYSTPGSNFCATLNFILHSASPANFSIPPPGFDPAVEKAVFDQILSTFSWTMVPTTALPSSTLVSLPSLTPVPLNTSTATFPPPPPVDTATLPASPTLQEQPSMTSTATWTSTIAPAETLTLTPSPNPPTQVASLKAEVTADLLSCRYGPGPEYLYLYALRKGAAITLIGWTGGSNWVWVAGRNRCWLNSSYIRVAGDIHSLPITYPEPAHLPVSPYYPPTSILSAVRNGDQVTIEWRDIPLRAGDEEDEFMLHYIVETWRCKNGQFIFDPLATNSTSITFIDELGCSQPSHGRVFVQEKHGFAGPAEIPWP